MRTLRWTILGALLASEAAYAGYGGLMRQAEQAAAEKRWDEALATYEEARQLKPKKTDPAAAIEATRAAAVADGIEQVRAALAGGDWEAAVAKLDWITTIDPDVPDAITLRTEAEKTLTDAVVKAWGAGDPRGSYTLAVRLRTLFPANKQLTRIFGTLRDHYTEQAEAELKAKAFEPALAAIRTIPEFEPEQSALAAPLEAKILAAWADDLVRQAKVDAAKGHDGAAAMRYARAFTIAGREADRAAAKKLGAKLRDAGQFTVDLGVTGAGSRSATVRKALEDAVASVGGRVAVAGADVSLRVSVPEVRCAETSTASPQSKDYVSGTRATPNPEHATLAADLKAATKAWTTAQTQVDTLAAKLAKQREAAKTLELQLEAAKTAVAAAVASAPEKLAALEAERAGLGLDALQSEHDAAVRQAAELLAAKDALAAKLEATPASTDEEVRATYAYDVKTWTRTCVAKASATAKPKWKTALPTANTYAPEKATTDTSSPGHAASGVVADPKAYPKDDRALIAEADAETADAIAKWAVALADEHYRVWTAETVAGLSAADPSTATTGAAALLLGAPGRLDNVQAEQIREHLRGYGVPDPEAALAP